MKLDEFITQTLMSIARGLENANIQLKKSPPQNAGFENFSIDKVGVTNDNNYISFDVAVYASTEVKGQVAGGRY